MGKVQNVNITRLRCPACNALLTIDEEGEITAYVETEPVEPEPVKTEPVETEPVETEPVEPESKTKPREGTVWNRN